MKTIKKSLCVLLVVVLLCSSLLITSSAADMTATPMKSTLNINNNVVNIEGYTINGSNYLKLRDLAVVIKDNGKNFSVNWEKATNIVWLRSGESYNPVGGELALSGNTASVKAVPTTTKVYLDENLIYLTAYLINNANYIKLRDLGAALDVAVTFDEALNMVSVDTSKEYHVTTLMDILEGAYYSTATKTIKYYGMDSGNLTIEKEDSSHFVITAGVITSAKDYATFKTIIGIYVNTPETVINTLDAMKYNGYKELKIDGKTLLCAYNGNEQSVDIQW